MRERKKNTSINQYKMFLEMMEKDSILTLGKKAGSRNFDFRFPAKWNQLCKKLNTCTSGPQLNAEEWYRRLSDWKHAIRRKNRSSISDNKTIILTSLEKRGLRLFGATHSFGPHSTSPKKDGSVAAVEPANSAELATQHQRAFEGFIAVKELDKQNKVDCTIGEDADGENNNVRESLPLQEQQSSSTLRMKLWKLQARLSKPVI